MERVLRQWFDVRTLTVKLDGNHPLAGMHLLQGIERLRMEGKPEVTTSHHPIEIFARAYGLV